MKKIEETREDEIISAAYDYIDNTEYPIIQFGDFINGAQFADITMLKKLREFI